MTAEILILSLVQGLTEFLPVSSSGHLYFLLFFFESFKELDTGFFAVILHLATLLAVIWVFRRECYDLILSFLEKDFLRGKSPFSENWRRSWVLMLFFGTIPTALVGFFFREEILSLGKNFLTLAFSFWITAICLFSTLWARSSQKENQVFWKQAILIGLSQALALVPGISRSGVTISVGLWLGLERKTAGHYSFFLSLPSILGASLLELLRIESFDFLNLPLFFLSFLMAFFTGLFTLKLLLSFIRRGRLHVFSYYCLGMGILNLILFLLG